jgi:hypothetical protein
MASLSLAVGVAVVPTAEAENEQSTSSRCDPYCYDPDYIFGVTRGTRDALSEPAVFILLSPLTLAADLALLPIEIALGLLG